MNPLLRAGDWLILLASGSVVVTLMLHYWWQTAPGERLLIHQNGTVFLNAPLTQNRIIDVPGPLGITRIELKNRQARVLSDPGPRQLCVRQGWITHAGDVAICLPNRISLEITGTTRPYDSLDY